jgi:hypothetical protein
MRIRFSLAVWALAAVSVPGCSLPRGPINIQPIVPRWVGERELGCDCPPEHGLALHGNEAGPVVDPSAIQPPISKFHPVPTRPVFEPPGAVAPGETFATTD